MQHIATFFTRATSPSWQDKLRASVRLYLALGAHPAAAQELEALLQHTEQDLLDYLLAGPLPSSYARERAQQFLDTAQREVLDSPFEVQALLAPDGFCEGKLAPLVRQGDFRTAGRQFDHEQRLTVGIPFLHGRGQVRGHGASHVHGSAVGGGVAVAQDGLHPRATGSEGSRAYALAGSDAGERNLEEGMSIKEG
jgi:hypothetical protein